MCPITEHPDQLPLQFDRRSGARQGEGCRSGLSATGSKDSPGPTGEPSLSERLSEMAVRLHQGLSSILVGSLTLTDECPATFTALKRVDLGGYTVMLSCVLTSSQYSALIAAMETTSVVDGRSATVEVKFEPLTPNLVPPTTAPSI